MLQKTLLACRAFRSLFWMGLASSKPASSSAVSIIKDLIQDNCVVIFSKSTCPYCRVAKQVFEKMDSPYLAVELDQRTDGPEIQDCLRTMTGVKTVPRVFVNGQCIGGGTETQRLFQENKLKDLVKACNSN